MKVTEYVQGTGLGAVFHQNVKTLLHGTLLTRLPDLSWLAKREVCDLGCLIGFNLKVFVDAVAVRGFKQDVHRRCLANYLLLVALQ